MDKKERDPSLRSERIRNTEDESAPARYQTSNHDDHNNSRRDPSLRSERICNTEDESAPARYQTSEHDDYYDSRSEESSTYRPSAGSFYAGSEDLPSYEYVRFTFIDINGVPRGKILPSKSAKKQMKSGIGCYAGAQAIGPNGEMILPKEVKDSHCSTMKIIPDPDTLRHVSWLPGYVLDQYLCGTYWDKDIPQESCTRSLLKSSLDNLKKMGCRLFSGASVEFTLLDERSMKPIFSESDFLSMPGQSKCLDALLKLQAYADSADIPIDAVSCGRQRGQLKFKSSASYDIRGIDDCVILRQCIKEFATVKGLNANFMAKRSREDSGNDIQFGLSLWRTKDETNMFWDKTTDDHLSEFAKRWLAGMLHHARALTALCCPTTNCYKRLHTEWAPHLANWGIDDRHTMLCVKNNQNGTYIANRLMSGLCNPYLAMAANIAAGLDGVINEMTCPEPHDVETAPVLPFTLQEALDCLQKDEVIVNTLGKTLVEWFILSKVSSELKDVEDFPKEMSTLSTQF